MRIRELLGLGITVLLWCFPFLLLLTLVAWLNGAVEGYVFFFMFLVGFAWPGSFLLAKRLREPPELDVVEADGRALVLVLHPAPAPGASWWRLFPTPAFFSDVRDARLLRALRRSSSAVGPMLRLERPSPPPTHGPVRRPGADAERREASLLDRARGAALVLIIVDGSEANLREIELVSGIVDVRRIVLVTPPELESEFFKRWEALRSRLPGLPEIDTRTAAVRFGEDARPTSICAPSPTFAARCLVLGQVSHLIHEHELRHQPKPPAISWMLSLLPIGAGFVSAFITPVFLEEHNLRVSGEGAALGTLASIALGFTIALMSRRLMRLVPTSELAIVVVAASPWLTMELLALAFFSSDLGGQIPALRDSGPGAAFAAPLLLTTGFVLAGATLIRRSPGRRWSFIVLGVAAIIPLLLLTTPLAQMSIDVGGLLGATVAGGVVLGIAMVAASGEASRRHAPLSIGAGVCAALAIAAWATTVTHGEWARQLRVITNAGSQEWGQSIVPLLDFDAYSVWLLLLLPLGVVLVGIRARGRCTKTATANAATLFPLALLLTLVAAGHWRARHLRQEQRAPAAAEVFVEAAQNRVAPGFALAALDTAQRAGGAADVVVDRGGALAGGRRVSSAVELSSFGSTGTPALRRAIADVVTDPGRGSVRVASARDASGVALLTVCRAVWSYTSSPVELIGQREDGRAASVMVNPYQPGRFQLGQGRVAVFLRVDHEEALLLDNFGTQVRIPRDSQGRISVETLRQQLSAARTREPDNHELTLIIGAGAAVQDLMRVLESAVIAGFDRFAFADQYMTLGRPPHSR